MRRALCEFDGVPEPVDHQVPVVPCYGQHTVVSMYWQHVVLKGSMF